MYHQKCKKTSLFEKWLIRGKCPLLASIPHNWLNHNAPKINWPKTPTISPEFWLGQFWERTACFIYYTTIATPIFFTLCTRFYPNPHPPPIARPYCHHVAKNRGGKIIKFCCLVSLSIQSTLVIGPLFYKPTTVISPPLDRSLEPDSLYKVVGYKPTHGYKPTFFPVPWGGLITRVDCMTFSSTIHAFTIPDPSASSPHTPFY